MIYYQGGNHHHSVVSTAAFYGVTFYSWGLLWQFLFLCFLSCLSVPALLSYIAPLALPDVSGSL